MAEFNESLLHFDNTQLDVNENPPNVENQSYAEIDKVNNAVPSKCELSPKCDLNASETLQSIEKPNNCIEALENTNQLDMNKLDVLLRNVDERDTQCSLTCDDALDLPTSTNNYIKLPEVTNEMFSNNLDVDVKENNVNNRNSDSGIHDSNNIVEDSNMIDFTGTHFNLSDDFGGMMTEFKNEENDVQVKEEEFHDAVQFFKDPSSFTFLEKAGSTNTHGESSMMRSSLYMNFDPLHAKFYSQSTKSNGLQEIVENDVELEALPNSVQDIVPDTETLPNDVQDIVPDTETLPNNVQDIVPDIVNKHLANVSPRESLGNILISFDSPVSGKDSNIQPVAESSKHCEPEKLYTEEELQQALKIRELSVQETFLKNQQELDLMRSRKQEEMETKLQEQNCLCKTLHCLLKEITDVAIVLSEKDKVLQQKLETTEKENDKLREDLKTSGEDLQSVETTFSDFHKRYEQCKSMLKVYTQNEDNLKQQLENMKIQLQEKDEMYKALQSRTEEMLDKANTEVASIKRAGDAQVAVLKAQLKKAELKISSLESDVKHVKIENGKLSSICDELMAKVSET